MFICIPDFFIFFLHFKIRFLGSGCRCTYESKWITHVRGLLFFHVSKLRGSPPRPSSDDDRQARRTGAVEVAALQPGPPPVGASECVVSACGIHSVLWTSRQGGDVTCSPPSSVGHGYRGGQTWIRVSGRKRGGGEVCVKDERSGADISNPAVGVEMVDSPTSDRLPSLWTSRCLDRH